MSEQGPQGFNSVTLADRTIRQLGVEAANTQINLATQNARLEELFDVSTHISFDQWQEIKYEPTVVSNEATEEEGQLPPAQGGMPPVPEPKYLVPAYQVDIVARLLSLLQRQ